jgi:hypothetical protein
MLKLLLKKKLKKTPKVLLKVTAKKLPIRKLLNLSSHQSLPVLYEILYCA